MKLSVVSYFTSFSSFLFLSKSKLIGLRYKKYCVAAGLSAVTEVQGVCAGKVPDTVVPGLDLDDKECLWDFTTGDPAAATNLNKSSFCKLDLANQTATNLKRATYSGTFDANLFSFQPIAMETSGRWS